MKNHLSTIIHVFFYMIMCIGLAFGQTACSTVKTNPPVLANPAQNKIERSSTIAAFTQHQPEKTTTPAPGAASHPTTENDDIKNKKITDDHTPVPLFNAGSTQVSQRQIDPLNNKKEPVTVTYTSIVHGNVTRLQPIIDAFNQANPGITVQFLPYPAGPMGTIQSSEGFKQFAAAKADTTLNEFIIQESDQFLDIQSLIDSDSTIQADDFWPGEWAGCQDKKGRTVGIPVNLHFHGVFYDQTAFSEAKISIPKPGWTWDDFRQAVNTLTRKTGNSSRFGYGAADPTYPEILLPLVAAGINKPDGKLDVDKLSRDLQWYVDMVRDDKFYPTNDLFKSGGTAKGVDNPWSRLFLENRQPAMWVGYIRNPLPDLALRAEIAHSMSEEYDPQTHLAISKFGLAPYPIETDGSNVHTTPIYAECALISATSTHMHEAMLWLNFLSRQWFMFDKSMPPSELANIPARPSVAEKVGFWRTLPAAVEPTVRYGLDHGLYHVPDYNTMKEVYTALDKAISGKSSLLSTLQEANKKIPAKTDPNKISSTSVATTPGSTQ